MKFNKKKIRWSTAILGGIVVLLLYSIAMQLTRGSQAAMILATAAKAEKSEPMVLNTQTKFVDVEVVQSRAIFYETRKFFIAPPMDSKPPRPDYRLVGTMMLPQKPMTAMLIHNQTGVIAKVHKGEQFEGWTVAAVEPKRVLLQQGDEQIEIGSSSTPSSAQTIASVQPITAGSSSAISRSNSGGIRVLGAPSPTASGAIRNASGMMQSAPTQSRLYKPPPQ